MKTILLKILKFLSKKVLKKYNPEVIGITGSIGKTTTKYAINEVLKDRYNVRASIGSFNTELGLPITILGLDNSKSKFVWIKNIFKAMGLLIVRKKDYPEILILEMGADKIGDIEYLTSIVKPDIAILTNIAPVHIEQFKTIENIYNEKIKIFDFNNKGQKKIINIDNEFVKNNIIDKNDKEKIDQIMFYGKDEIANVRAYNLEEKNCFDNDYTTGIEFDVFHDNEECHVKMQYMVGGHQVYAILAAFSVGILFDLRLEDIKNSLEDTRGEKGRMSLIKGIKNTWIIDDSYNSSPVACKSAVLTLSKSKNSGRKIAILGDMLELGTLSEDSHKEVGKFIANLENIDLLITVGERARDINSEAILSGFDENLSFNFKTSDEAKDFVQNKMKENDLLLIKGSQSMRMEKITKEVMNDPQNAKELLVRQTGIWENK